MEDDKYLGKKFVTTILVEKVGNEYRVTQRIEHSRSLDLDKWEEADVSITAIDKDSERALASCFASIAKYLETINFDLFKARDQIEGSKN